MRSRGRRQGIYYFLSKLIRPYLGYVCLFLVLAVFASLMDGISVGMLVPLLTDVLSSSQGNETGIPNFSFPWISVLSDEYRVYIVFAFVILSVLLKNVIIATSTFIGYWISSKILEDIQVKISNLLMYVDLNFHRSSKTGDLIDKSLDCTGKVEILFRFGIDLIASILTLPVLIGILLILSWQLTLVILLYGLLAVLLVLFYNRSLKRLGKGQERTARMLKNIMLESLAGIRVIKAVSKENEQAIQLNNCIASHRRKIHRLNFQINSVNPLFDSLGVIGIALICAIALWGSVEKSSEILAILLPFIYILLRLVPLVRLMHWQYAEVVGRWSYIDTVRNLLSKDDKPFMVDGFRRYLNLSDCIRFQSVTFSYSHDHERRVLSNISCKIPCGKTTAIIGHSGSGKSTAAMLLLRFSDPQNGEILFDDTPLKEFQMQSFRRKIGFVSQETFLFNETVFFNIGYGIQDNLCHALIIEAAKQAGAHEFIMSMPDQYETIIGEQGVKLSGGQRQRLAIARAIATEPDILLLDEATSALDIETEQHIYETIDKLKENRTVIIITHRLSTLKNVDHIIVLKDGKVVESGSIYELVENNGEYCKMANLCNL